MARKLQPKQKSIMKIRYFMSNITSSAGYSKTMWQLQSSKRKTYELLLQKLKYFEMDSRLQWVFKPTKTDTKFN